MVARRRPDGVVAIAVYYLVVALMFLVASCVVLLAIFGISREAHGDPVGMMWAMFGVGIGLLFLLICLIGSVLAGWGLLKMSSWGRWAAIVMGVVQLLAIPVGTAIGGVILYYLFREDVRRQFEDATPAASPLVAETSMAASEPVVPAEAAPAGEPTFADDTPPDAPTPQA